MIGDARRSVRSVAAIIDAEVEQTKGTGYRSWAVLKPLEVWKGNYQPSYRVAYLTSCDIAYWRKGARYRVMLSGGPTTFQADMAANGVLVRDSRTFDREVDRLIGNTRPAKFANLNTE